MQSTRNTGKNGRENPPNPMKIRIQIKEERLERKKGDGMDLEAAATALEEQTADAIAFCKLC